MNNNISFSMFLLFFVFSCSSPADDIAKREAEAKKNQGIASKPEGSAVFKKYCVACHGIDGKLAMNGAKDITLSTLNIAERVAHIANGKGIMPPFKDVLSPEELQAVAEYVESLRK
jgi:cytochrome c6